MGSALVFAPVFFWFLVLFVFYYCLKKEYPFRYHKLKPWVIFRKTSTDAAADIILFFLQRRHRELGGKVAIAGLFLEFSFFLSAFLLLVVFWLGATGKI